MYSRRWLATAVLLIGLGLIAAVPGASSTQAQSNPVPGQFKIGLIRSMFRHVPEAAFPMLASPFKRLMRDQVGMTGDVFLVADAETLASQLTSGETSLGVFSGYEFAWVRTHFPSLQPLVLAVGHESRPTAVVVVRKDSPVQSLDDLKDRPAVLARDCKEFCRLYAERRCPKTEARFGLNIAAKLVEPSCCADALDDVIDHRITATVVDGGALGLFRELKPVRAAWLRTLCSSEPFPATVVVYRRGAIDDLTIQRFLRVLTGSRHTTQYRDLMRLWKMRGFEPIPADYDEQLTQVLKAYPPPEGFCSTK